MHQRLKRVSLIFSSLILVVLLLCPTALAIETSSRASLYLDGYEGYLTPGNRAGYIDISYLVEGKGISSDMLGVSKIVIYRTDGTYVTTINGSLANGLLEQNTGIVVGTYTYHGSAGASYYAVMTMYAANDGGSDSKLYTTNSVTAP